MLLEQVRSARRQAGTRSYKTSYSRNSWKSLEQKSDMGFKMITLATCGKLEGTKVHTLRRNKYNCEHWLSPDDNNNSIKLI